MNGIPWLESHGFQLVFSILSHVSMPQQSLRSAGWAQSYSVSQFAYNVVFLNAFHYIQLSHNVLMRRTEIKGSNFTTILSPPAPYALGLGLCCGTIGKTARVNTLDPIHYYWASRSREEL